jgi:hypothetical protein
MKAGPRLFSIAERIAGRLSDRVYLSLRFRRKFGAWPSIGVPRRFNEHLLRYKLTSRGDRRLPHLANKILVKEHVAGLIGPEHVIPTLWHGPALPPRSERNWPKPYVLKSSHGCDHTIMVSSPDDERWDEIDERVGAWLSTDYGIGRQNREWHYAHIDRGLLVEPMIGDGVSPPPDYKFFVFGGRVELVWRDDDRTTDHRRVIYDRNWIPQPFDFNKPRGEAGVDPPDNLPAMIELAERLAQDLEFVRVDFYDVDGRVYFGELTFFPAAGNGQFRPPEADLQVGRLWTRAVERNRAVSGSS